MTNKQLEDLKEHLPAALATWQQSKGSRVTVGWLHVANPEVIASLLTELEKAQQLIKAAEIRDVEKLAAALNPGLATALISITKHSDTGEGEHHEER